MENIFVIENLFKDDEFNADEFNDIVIKKISTHPGWYLSNDEERQKLSVDDDYSDTGMLLESFYSQNINQSENHQEINFIGNMIYEKILESIPFEFVNPKLVRFLWNYYNRASTGVPHKDMADNIDGNFCSIVYHLNNCDGKTIIGDDEFLSKSGQCLIFDSKKLHQGIGPKKYPKRYCLNIMIEFDSIKKPTL